MWAVVWTSRNTPYSCSMDLISGPVAEHIGSEREGWLRRQERTHVSLFVETCAGRDQVQSTKSLDEVGGECACKNCTSNTAIAVQNKQTPHKTHPLGPEGSSGLCWSLLAAGAKQTPHKAHPLKPEGSSGLCWSLLAAGAKQTPHKAHPLGPEGSSGLCWS